MENSTDQNLKDLKEDLKHSKKFIKKYLSDILILGGVLLLSYNILKPPESLFVADLANYHTEEKVLGIFLIAVGLDIAIRKYLASKNERKN